MRLATAAELVLATHPQRAETILASPQFPIVAIFVLLKKLTHAPSHFETCFIQPSNLDSVELVAKQGTAL